MPSVTVTQASKLTGVTRKTIYLHIKKGKLSRAAGGLLDITELLRCYGPFVEQVTPRVLPKETPSDTMVTLSEKQLSLIIKDAVKAALLEAMPLLLENKNNEVADTTGDHLPIATAKESEELMRDGTPFKKLNFDDIPSLGGKFK